MSAGGSGKALWSLVLARWSRASMFMIMLVVGAVASAQPVELEKVEVPAATEQVIRKALDFIASRQHPRGFWVEMVGRKVNDEYRGYRGNHVGVTALACMAFLSNGSTPGRGRYGDNVQRGLDWVLSQVRPDDGFVTSDGSRMYSHGFATLFLAEAYGMSGNGKVRAKLQASVDCIVKFQNEQGGWRYLPGAKDSDISITVTSVMALRAARNVGVFVPRGTIEKSIEYVKRSHISRRSHRTYGGGFWYQIFDQPFRMSRTSFALTAAGVTALFGAGDYDSDEVREGLHYLRDLRRRPSSWKMHQSFDYFYGHYYAVQAFYQDGRYWREWYRHVHDELLVGVNEDGYWSDLVGPVYATSMATIILQVPYRYLPIFER